MINCAVMAFVNCLFVCIYVIPKMVILNWHDLRQFALCERLLKISLQLREWWFFWVLFTLRKWTAFWYSPSVLLGKITDTICGYVTNTFSTKLSMVKLDISPVTLDTSAYYFNQLMELCIVSSEFMERIRVIFHPEESF